MDKARAWNLFAPTAHAVAKGDDADYRKVVASWQVYYKGMTLSAGKGLFWKCATALRGGRKGKTGDDDGVAIRLLVYAGNEEHFEGAAHLWG
jgi:hypothetical protein